MLTLTAKGDTQVLVTRHFSAQPQQIWDAHVDANLIAHWMLGPEGWVMTLCESDGTPGGDIHFVWANATGQTFSLTGEVLDVQPPTRMVHIERMHLPNTIPDTTPDNHVETLIEPAGTGSKLTLIMTLPDRQTREVMLDTGMADGMEASYARLDALLTPKETP